MGLLPLPLVLAIGLALLIMVIIVLIFQNLGAQKEDLGIYSVQIDDLKEEVAQKQNNIQELTVSRDKLLHEYRIAKEQLDKLEKDLQLKEEELAELKEAEKPEAKPVPRPEPKPEPKPEVKPETKPEIKPKPDSAGGKSIFNRFLQPKTNEEKPQPPEEKHKS